MKKFKRVENDLIWEGYSGQPDLSDEYNADQSFYDDSEDAEVVMEFEPEGELEPELDMGEDFDDVLEDDDELDNEIIVKSLRKLMKRAEILLTHCQTDELETWMVAKIIKAEDYISDVWEELDDVADFANDGFEDSDNIDL